MPALVYLDSYGGGGTPGGLGGGLSVGFGGVSGGVGRGFGFGVLNGVCGGLSLLAVSSPWIANLGGTGTL